MDLVRVVVDGQAIPQRTSEGDAWVALDRGAAYEIDVASPYSMPVKAVVTVDGKNVMDNTNVDNPLVARGVILRPGTAARIPGWRVGDGEWAKFEISDLDRAYAAGSDPNRLGRIDVRFVAGHTATPTPLVRGETPIDVATAFGAFKRAPAPFEDSSFLPRSEIGQKTIFYATPDTLDQSGIRLPALPADAFCTPPPGWAKTPEPGTATGRKKGDKKD